MQVLLFGASGALGSTIARELLRRGHQVRGATRHGSATALPKGSAACRANVTDRGAVAAVASGQDAVISAVGPRLELGEDVAVVTKAAAALVDGVRDAGVDRLLVVGGAGGLQVAPGVRLVDTPDFPEAWRAVAEAHVAAFEVYRTAEGLRWTVVAPAALVQPGRRTGRYRTAEHALLVGPDGTSAISTEDFAVAVVDELEQGRAVRRRLHVAY